MGLTFGQEQSSYCGGRDSTIDNNRHKRNTSRKQLHPKNRLVAPVNKLVPQLDKSVTSKASLIIKSAIMSKKEDGFMGSYQAYLFQLYENGLLRCYDVPKNKEKIKRDELLLTNSSIIERKCGSTWTESKFTIYCDDRQWHLWCNYSSEHGKQQAIEWCDALNEVIEQPPMRRMSGIHEKLTSIEDVSQIDDIDLEEAVDGIYGTDHSESSFSDLSISQLSLVNSSESKGIKKLRDEGDEILSIFEHK